MNTMAARFRLMVDQVAGGNKKQFAELTGKSASHIYRICRGKGRPSLEFLTQLNEQFQVDLNWLITGEQSMAANPVGQAPAANDLVYAPVFDVRASAGFGVMNDHQESQSQIAFDKGWLAKQLGSRSEQLAFVEVQGDSMTPTLDDGDLILVDMEDRHISKDQVYLLRNGGDLLTKRLHHQGSSLYVKSDNPDYPDYQIDLHPESEAEVLGRVIWSTKRL